MTKKYLLLSLFMAPLLTFSQNMYKVIVTRAAPGDLESLIEVVKSDLKSFNSKSNTDAYLLRHSQGDQWDLMIVAPVLDYSQVFDKPYGSDELKIVARQEEAFIMGPTHEVFDSYFSDNNFFHIEMFISLPGFQNELKKEREMENTYLEETSRKPNLIFTKLTGFEFDILTIGAYKSIIEYAEGGNQPDKVQEKAAIKSGFKSAADIGFYLRSLISEHHDTLANKIVE